MTVIKTIAICAGLFLTELASGQVGNYNLASVPDSIKNKADIIVHEDKADFTLESIDKSTLDIHRVFTVVNEDGNRALFFRGYSSKAISLEDVDIRVLDAKGKQTARYKKKDMQTVAIGEGLVDDGYITYYRIPATNYPITVEVNYQQKFKNTINIPDFYFITSKEGVLTSDYTFRLPAAMKMRYKTANTSIQPSIAEEGKYKVYRWSAKNLVPFAGEEASGPGKYPNISITTDLFSVYDVEGDLSSWKTFGSWINDLYKGLDELPPARQQFFRELVKNAPDEKEKIKLIYNYLQHNFRYVSIQMGIGGLKPFPANFTDQKKYGDCKGLSNYMKAALKAVGITSHIAIINSGSDAEPVDPDFPANRFNHAILCVPGNNDSTWLECTSSTAGFGDLGTFTENRNALLLTDQGGVLVHTPESRSAANQLHSVTTVNLSDDMSAITETLFTGTGEYAEMIDYMLKEKSDDQKKYLVNGLGFRQPDVFEFVKGIESDSYDAKLRMLINKVPDFTSGDKQFMNARINKIWASKLPKAESRKFDYYFRYPFEKTDTTVFRLPKGAKPEVLLPNKQLTCAFATYQFSSWFNETENAVYSVTSLVLRQHKIPVAGYPEIKKFFDDLLQEDAQKIVVKALQPEKKAF